MCNDKLNYLILVVNLQFDDLRLGSQQPVAFQSAASAVFRMPIWEVVTPETSLCIVMLQRRSRWKNSRSCFRWRNKHDQNTSHNWTWRSVGIIQHSNCNFLLIYMTIRSSGRPKRWGGKNSRCVQQVIGIIGLLLSIICQSWRHCYWHWRSCSEDHCSRRGALP